MPTTTRDRTAESELMLPALRIASGKPNGCIQTSELIDALSNLFQPEGEDADILANRNDTKFSQKVRNLVSHRDQENSMFYLGLAIYTGDGLQITDSGRRYVEEHS
ncbi:MAG: hypothetical protein WCF85_08625 [Rhodospirillaceae bacterium]